MWYAVFSAQEYIPKGSTRDSEIVKNLTNAVPIMVGSIVFVIIGTHMALSGSNKKSS